MNNCKDPVRLEKFGPAGHQIHLENFIKKTPTRFYKEEDSKPYKAFEIIEYLLDNFPELTRAELNNLSKLDDNTITRIVTMIPLKRVTEKHKQLIIEYIKERKRMLMEINEK